MNRVFAALLRPLRLWRIVCLAAVVGLVDCSDAWSRPDVDAPPQCNWTQWGHDRAHSGTACAPGQRLSRSLARIVIDPFADQEMADTDDELLVRYQVPLL